jgi:hypothetical protein
MFFVAPFGEVGHGVSEATELRRRELGQAERHDLGRVLQRPRVVGALVDPCCLQRFVQPSGADAARNASQPPGLSVRLVMNTTLATDSSPIASSSKISEVASTPIHSTYWITRS